MYTLYGHKRAGSVAVEIALTHAGVPFRQVAAATWVDASAVAELRRVNPLQQIPTLVLPDGSIMTESAAILIHLGMVLPQAKILPEDPARRAQCIRGLVFIAANCYSAISILDYPERWAADAGKELLEKIDRGTHARLYRHWEIFADTFTDAPFLSGAEPGGLDYLAAVVSKWGKSRQHLRAARPDFHKTLKRIERHDSVAPVFTRHWPAAAKA